MTDPPPSAAATPSKAAASPSKTTKRGTHPMLVGCMLPFMVWAGLIAIAWTSEGVEFLTGGAVVLLPDKAGEFMGGLLFNFFLWAWMPYLLLWSVGVAAANAMGRSSRRGRR